MQKLVFLLIGLFSAFLLDSQTIEEVGPEKFRERMSEKNTVVIDLRTPAEIARKGKIKGAKEIDYLAPGAEARIDSLDRSKTYLVYCAGGGRSGECAGLMREKGFKRIVNLSSGFDAWLRRGYEVEKE